VKLNNIILCLVMIGLYGCASTEMGSLEAAKFALDKGEYTEAITEATEALNANPANYEAARVLASAYFARSGFDYFDIAEGVMDLQNSDTPNFQQVADVFPATADLGDLRSAIEVLEGLAGIGAASLEDTEELADAAFDLGLMEIVEHFALGVYGADYFDDNDVTEADVTDITEAYASHVQTDLVDFDNRLIAAGVANDEDWLEEIRQTFCILEPISAGEGFTLAEYQAFVGCQLSSTPDTFDTASITADIANCDAVNPEGQGDAVEACYLVNTSL